MLKRLKLALSVGAIAITSMAIAQPAEAPEQDTARPPTQLAAREITYANIASVLVISVNDEKKEVLFIAHDGRNAAVRYLTCARIPFCHDLFNKLVSENKVQELSIPFGIQI